MLVREKSGKNYYAAKMMSKEDLVRLKQVAHVHNEKHVLNAARFPFLIYLVDSTKCFDYLYLILPLVNGGELFSYHRRWVFPFWSAHFIWSQTGFQRVSPPHKKEFASSTRSTPDSMPPRWHLLLSICTRCTSCTVIWSRRTFCSISAAISK